MTAETVDQYLAEQPNDVREVLQELRQTIRAAAPMAEEVISYQIPLYKYKGHVVGFASFKHHCSLFCTNSGLLKKYKKELAKYEIRHTTVHFTVDKPLPKRLVTKIVKERVKQNEERHAAKG